eukprot:Skav229627  [mRNA]  locus=scaffold649:9656:14851:+ [translate_table: standard]
MDDEWTRRLLGKPLGEPLGRCFLVEYVKALRLISGISHKGYWRMMAVANAHRADQERRMQVLSSGPVRSFVNFLSHYTAEERSVMWEIIQSHLFPDSRVKGLFRAAATDPLTDPQRALEEASAELEEIGKKMCPVPLAVPEPGRFSESSQRWNPELFFEVVCGEKAPDSPPFLPSMISGWGGPGVSHCMYPPRVAVPQTHSAESPEVAPGAPVGDKLIVVQVFEEGEFKGLYSTTVEHDTSAGLIVNEVVGDMVANNVAISPNARAGLYVAGSESHLAWSEHIQDLIHPTEILLTLNLDRQEYHFPVAAFQPLLRKMKEAMEKSKNDTPQEKDTQSQGKRRDRADMEAAPEKRRRRRNTEAPASGDSVPKSKSAPLEKAGDTKDRPRTPPKVDSKVDDPPRARVSKWDPPQAASSTGPAFQLTFVPPGRKHRGRGTITRPIKRLLAAPRVKFGRPTDFRTDTLATTVRVRQLTKQARRLQSLARLVTRLPSGCCWWQSGQTGLLWQAILSATGFRPNFYGWVRDLTTVQWQDPPSFSFVSQLHEAVAQEANAEASRASATKKTKFVDALDACWKNEGGKLAFKLLRDKPLPPVQDLCLSVPLLLAPQQWAPTGKAWIKVRNLSDFRPGDHLTGGGTTVEILEICHDSVLLSQRLSRRQAIELSKTVHTADPDVWVPEFLKQWEQFWQREESPSGSDIDHIVSRLPSHQVDLGPLSLEVWEATLRMSNTSTMRGTDAWTIKELRQVPSAFVRLLLDILQTCETRAVWPQQLTQWLLIFLRKNGAKVPSWDLLRPISVAGLIYRVLVHTGFPVTLITAWFSALDSMTRRVLLAGYCYGSSASHTGVPEGDPLSVVAMYVMAWAFGQYMVSYHGDLVPATYADNWQLLTRTSRRLLQAIPTLERFLECACLPVAPSKCWVWSITPLGRKRLRSLRLFEATVPLQFQGKELGADVSYCYRKAAKVRVFPHVLHGAETSCVPRTVLQRLRSYTSLALNLRKKGSSPWLACIVGTYRCVDPEYILLMNRIQLFRQVLRELPDLAPLLKGQLSQDGRYKGPTQLLVCELHTLGWNQVGEGTFSDSSGRTFHVVMSSFAHIESLLLSSWADKVCQQVAHRKYLEGLDSLDVAASTCASHLLPSERALLIPQRLGAFYSGEHTKHFAPEATFCPLCGAVDSRLHRVSACPQVQTLRTTFPQLDQAWDSLPSHTQTFGLWSELPALRPWQASLDALALPDFDRTQDEAPVALYTDGSCLHPRNAACRIAAYAVIEAGPDGTLVRTVAGPLPGSRQTPFRTELLALGIAFSMHSKVWVFTDCLAVAKRANRLLAAKRTGRPLVLPSVHTDLWTLFALQLGSVVLAECRIEWIPSHRDWSSCHGVQRIHAWFNHWADQAAKQALTAHRTPLYEAHFAAWTARQPLVHSLARFHAGAALLFIQEQSEHTDHSPVQVHQVVPLGPASFCTLTSAFPPPSRRLPFTRDLAQWLFYKPWFASVHLPGLGLLTDMSWLELFWVFVWDTRGYPPFQFEGSWVRICDDPILTFALPSAWSLYRYFVFFVSSLLKAGVSCPWGHELSQVGSVSLLGARFPCSGFPGRIAMTLDAVRSLCDILASCPKVSALRLPFV